MNLVTFLQSSHCLELLCLCSFYIASKCFLMKPIPEAVAWRYSGKKVIFRNFANFTGKYLCQSLFFNKVAGLMLATLLKKRLWYRSFPLKFAKFLRTLFLQNTSSGCFSISRQFSIWYP